MYLIKQIAYFCIQMMSMVKKEMKDHKTVVRRCEKKYKAHSLCTTAAMHLHDSCDAFA
jgi:hypothetical protein